MPRFKTLFIILMQFAFAASVKGSGIPDSLRSMAQNQPQKALQYLKAGEAGYQSDKEYFFLLANANENLGKYYLVDSIIELAFRTTDFSKDSDLYYRFVSLKADNDKIEDRYEDALLSLTSIKDYQSRKKDSLALFNTFMAIAETYRAAENYPLALDYLKKVINLGSRYSKGLPVGILIMVYHRKAAIFLEQAVHLDSVEYLSKEVIRMAAELGNHDQEATSCNELGFLYLNTNNPQGESYLKRAIRIWQEMGYHLYANNARMNLSRFYVRFGQPNKAIELIGICMADIKQNNWDWELGYCYEILSQAYEKKGDYKTALKYMIESKEEMLMNSRKQYKNKLAYYANKLELKEREEEIMFKNQQVISAYEEISATRRKNRNLGIGLIILVTILAGSILVTLIINRQKKLLAEHRSKISKINLELESLITQKESLLQEVNHRVKNNLSLLSGLMYLKEKELKNEEAIDAMRETQGRINTISMIHETLYLRDDMEQVDLQDYLVKLTGHISQVYSIRTPIQMNIQCQGYKPNLQIAIPLAMMVNEMITNSLKHAFLNIDNPSINIQYDANLNQLEYYDNGPGFETNTKSNSLGRNLISIFAKQINAKIEFIRPDDYFHTIVSLPTQNLDTK